MNNVRAVRSGDVSHILPGLLPDIWPKPIIANTIDIACRFTSEQIGVMPTVSCTAGVMVSDRQKKYAQKRTLIARHYTDESKLKIQLLAAADWYDSYGFLPIIVEPNFGDAYSQPGPRIRFDNPMASYYDLDAYGRTRVYVKVYEEEVASLAARFPHLARNLVDDPSELNRSRMIELVQYIDEDQFVMFLPQRQNLIVHQMANKMGKVPVFVAERPKYDRETRGSYDDVMWIQMARAKFAMLGLESAEKSVQAPLAIPSDVQKISVGPDAVIRSNNPEKIRRVGMEMSPAAFQVGELLNNEVMVGSRFPEGATGKSPGSVVTGAGMDSLMGTIDTKVKTSQLVIGDALRGAVGYAFEMDQKFWPSTSRILRVMVNGSTFEDTYTPVRDIAGSFQVDVTYGFAAGMDPNRALVFLLQLRGDKAISRDFMLRNMPFDVNLDQELERTDLEELDDALKLGLATIAQSIGMLAQQGQDPIDIIQKLNKVGKLREKGIPLRDAVEKAFTTQVPPPGSTPPGAAQGAPPDLASMLGGAGAGPGAQEPGGGAPPGGQPPGGAMPGGQPQGGPGGPQDLMKMLAGLSGGGAPNLQANVARRVPAG